MGRSSKKKMPLDSYTWTHANANLTQNQIDAIVSWAKKNQRDYKTQLNKRAIVDILKTNRFWGI